MEGHREGVGEEVGSISGRSDSTGFLESLHTLRSDIGLKIGEAFAGAQTHGKMALNFFGPPAIIQLLPATKEEELPDRNSPNLASPRARRRLARLEALRTSQREEITASSRTSTYSKSITSLTSQSRLPSAASAAATEAAISRTKKLQKEKSLCDKATRSKIDAWMSKAAPAPEVDIATTSRETLPDLFSTIVPSWLLAK
jgi:hypothetical protein